MIELKSPTSTATIKVPDEAVEKYQAQGWTKVAAPKPARQKRTPDEDE